MTNIKRLISVLLVLAILISAISILLSFKTSALSSKGTVTANSLNIRPDVNTSGNSLGKVPGGATVILNAEKQGQVVSDGTKSSDIWYNITYNSITGWVSSLYINQIPDYVLDEAFEAHISSFPESYKPYLRELHAQYPNWKFYPDKVGLTFDKAVDLETLDDERDTTSNYKVVSASSKNSWFSLGFGAYNWQSGQWVAKDGKWYVASREVIRHYLDPRNYLNSSAVYAFLPQVYNESTQTEEGLNKIIKGTFLENGYSDPNDTAYGGSYAKVLMAAAKASGVSPYILAGIIIQEQGTKGTSFMISGTYGGEGSSLYGYYNFFNVDTYGDTDAQKAERGLGKAKAQGWNTRSASIIGGASFCANNYLGVGQNTYYYMNFNVKQPDRIWHQYATNAQDSYGKAQNLAKSYVDFKDAELDFMIPVYDNMPETAAELPDKNDNLNNYYISGISITTTGTASNLTPSFYMYQNNYELNVWENTTIKVDIPAGAQYVGARSFALKVGENNVTLTVKSQTGYLNDYIINVRADKACALTIDAPLATAYMRGDTNGDGVINGRDLANVQMHILSVLPLSGNSFTYADTNGDGNINGRDLADVQMDILGIRKLN